MGFHPASAPPPEEKRTDRLLLRPLRATDVERDYDAVMSSATELRCWSQSDWPADDFTLAENLDDLKRHEREHEAREAFTYTVLDPTGARCLGCVYLTPLSSQVAQLCPGANHAVNVGFWVRTSELANGLDQHLFATVREWLRTDWSFDCVVFTISPREARQATLFREAGLELLSEVTRPDGRKCWVFQ